MGDIGYQNNKENESGIKACYRNVDAYVQSLKWAIETPYSGYEEIDLVKDGVYQQLNANILQIENEYYSTVRPKQILQGLEKPVHALSDRGVKYVELRSLDVNAFEPLGINQTQCRFIEALMIFCMLSDSEQICFSEREEIDHNELLVAHRGREPGLKLRKDAKDIRLRGWAYEICQLMQGICEVLDEGFDDEPYQRALKRQLAKIEDPELTPSARMLSMMRENKEGFYHFAKRMSHQHYEFFKSVELNETQQCSYEAMAKESHQKQKEIEDADTMSFEEYLKAYFEERL
jgi:glutamate--cysteine ligase